MMSIEVHSTRQRRARARHRVRGLPAVTRGFHIRRTRNMRRRDRRPGRLPRELIWFRPPVRLHGRRGIIAVVGAPFRRVGSRRQRCRALRFIVVPPAANPGRRNIPSIRRRFWVKRIARVGSVRIVLCAHRHRGRWWGRSMRRNNRLSSWII